MRILLSIWLLGTLPRAIARTNCTREFHSAIINNQTLYIDGGEMRFREENKSITASAIRDLQAVDLSKSWTNSDSSIFVSIPKPYNDSHPNDYPSFLNDGASFSNGTDLFFYGGDISGRNGPDSPPSLATWRYNIAGDEWSKEGFRGSLFMRLDVGLTAQSSFDKKAYFLGGYVTPSGNPAAWGTNAPTYMVRGLLTLDQETLEWKNASSKGLNTWGTVAEGYMNLIETVGDEGVLVAFGGFTRPVGFSMHGHVQDQTKDRYHNSMENVTVYDIANATWHTQRTTGDIPTWRMAGCSVMVPAQDDSSFSIYVFGGIGLKTGDGDGDVYVLSIPSFRWIRVKGGNNVRVKHKCQVIGHSMLVVGGTVPTDDSEYEPEPGSCDQGTFANGIGIFDLNHHNWRSDYDADDLGQYTLGPKITKVIGGNSTGGATVTEPEDGFANDDLKAIFAKRNDRTTSTSSPESPATSTPTSTSTTTPDSGLSGGAIAGIVVGIVAGVAAILGIAFFLIRSKRKHNTVATGDVPPASGPDDPDKQGAGFIAEAPAPVPQKVAYEMDGTPGVPELMDEREHQPVEIDDSKRDMAGTERQSWSVLDHRS